MTEILNHYNLSTLQPTEWPAEKDEDDSFGNDDIASQPLGRPKYASLQRGGSTRSSVHSTQRVDGKQNMVQKDEPDPLGSGSSILQLLYRQGIPVNDDLKTRNQFLLSSTTFSPVAYLSQAQSGATIEELLTGLDFLSNSIEQKSASLKVLVESNFERFVRAKATIDNVYSEMRKHGDDDGQDVPTSPVRMRPTRSISGQGYASLRSKRGTSFGQAPSPTVRTATATDERRKNALAKDAEYGVQGIRLPLNEAAGKAEEIWGPALGGRDREDSLKSALNSIEKNRSILDVGVALEDCIKVHDYTGVTENYTRAHKYAVDAKAMADRAKQNEVRLSDSQLQQIIITARVWLDVKNRVEEFKQEIWECLSSLSISTLSGRAREDEELELVSLLLSLGTEDSPITMWLRNRISHFKARISLVFDRARVELEIARRKLAAGRESSPKTLANYVRNCGKGNRKDGFELDSSSTISYWEKVCNSLNALLSMQNGLLGAIVDFTHTMQSFIDGKKQRTLPTGIDGQSRRHHKLDPKAVQDLQSGVLGLFGLIRDQVHGFLVEAPIDDVSALLSAVPQTPASPPGSEVMSPTRATVFTFKPEDVPAPLSKTGYLWEKYAFWPPHSNSLSAGFYLRRILTTTATTFGEIASVSTVSKDNYLGSQLRDLINEVRERAVTAVCAAWSHDSERLRELESWIRSPERKDLTDMPTRLASFEMALLDDLQVIVYLPSVQQSSKIIGPPPQKVIELVQRSLKGSLLKSLGAMMEYVTKAGQADSEEDDGLTKPLQRGIGAGSHEDAVDVANTNVRKILTMSNLSHLRSDTIPKLYSHLETTFSISASDDLKSFRDTLHSMHSRVFQSYIRPTVDKLWSIINSGIVTLSYAPASASNDPNAVTMPSDARPYVYTVLLTLVMIHAELTATAPSLVSSILSTLLEQISAAFLEAFTQRQRYTLPALMQATLDVEFTAQTLNLYTTEKVAEAQGLIYGALDERTDNDARLRLQGELPGMRAVLKRLREGTRGVFGCFRKERRKGTDKAGQEKNAAGAEAKA